jgi:tetratricopeptide (TPR) repeat protein
MPATGDSTFERPASARARTIRPDLPDDITSTELPREMRAELRSLPQTLAETVGRHVAATLELMDEDPEAAYAHAAYARELAPRLPLLRGIGGFLAYRTGRFSEALADFRTVRRMTGQTDVLPAMADCERGLGRPERALDLAHEATGTLPLETRIELAIVASGARRDLGQFDAAVLELQRPELETRVQAEWAPRLWYAYAEALLAAGRRPEAIEWFTAAAEIDDDDQTDAVDRLEELIND